jgi:hypothetical protein
VQEDHASADSWIEITTRIPAGRVPEYYTMIGQWLSTPPSSGPEVPPAKGSKPQPWSSQDTALAAELLAKLSPAARKMFEVLSTNPGQKYSGEELADTLAVPNGKYGIAGVLAWPGRYSLGMGRTLPVEAKNGDGDGGSDYWMTKELAALFSAAKKAA